jgi:hypothetical protein
MGGQRDRKKQKQPLMPIDPKLRQAILDTERVIKDDEPISHLNEEPALECFEDGFPKLPEFLDRRPKRLLAEAA